MTIPSPATGTPIASVAYGQRVADSINNQAGRFRSLLYSPGANVNMPLPPPAGLQFWFSPGTIAIPAWATAARITMAINYVSTVAVNNSAYCTLQIDLDGAGAGRATNHYVKADASEGFAATWTVIDRIPIIAGAGTTKNFRVLAERFGGVATPVLLTNSDCCVLVEFEGAEQ